MPRRIEEIISSYIAQDGGYRGDTLVLLQALESLQVSLDGVTKAINDSNTFNEI